VDFEKGLNYCVRHLRAALGDDARRPRFIETVARQGYRFVAPVNPGRSMPAVHRRRRVIAGVAAVAAAVWLTLVVERGGRNQHHHETAVAIARAVHDLIF
jgi:DNA-binding winged helix-turn-helix (wHTH) protein